MSYAKFSYSNVKSEYFIDANKVHVSVDIKNNSNLTADEVVQLYLAMPDVDSAVPIKKLVKFSRISLASNQSKVQSFTLDKEDLSYVDELGNLVSYQGRLVLSFGNGGNEKSTENDLIKTEVIITK